MGMHFAALLLLLPLPPPPATKNFATLHFATLLLFGGRRRWRRPTLFPTFAALYSTDSLLSRKEERKEGEEGKGGSCAVHCRRRRQEGEASEGGQAFIGVMPLSSSLMTVTCTSASNSYITPCASSASLLEEEAMPVPHHFLLISLLPHHQERGNNKSTSAVYMKQAQKAAMRHIKYVWKARHSSLFRPVHYMRWTHNLRT